MAVLNRANNVTSLTSRTSAGAAQGDAARFAQALHRLDVEHRRLRAGFADRFSLAHNEYDAFMMIAEAGTTTPKQLAQHLRFTTGATTAMIDRLENARLVHRIPNPDDRRSVLIELSPDGESASAWVQRRYIEAARRAVDTAEAATPELMITVLEHTTGILAETADDL